MDLEEIIKPQSTVNWWKMALSKFFFDDLYKHYLQFLILGRPYLFCSSLLSFWFRKRAACASKYSHVCSPDLFWPCLTSPDQLWPFLTTWPVVPIPDQSWPVPTSLGQSWPVQTGSDHSLLMFFICEFLLLWAAYAAKK